MKIALGLFLATVFLSADAGSYGTGRTYPRRNQVGNIAEELTKRGFTTLVDLVTKAGLAETLSTQGPFTVFAPTNDAFAALDPNLVSFLVNNPEELKSVLLYHVVSGSFPARSLSNDLVADSVQGAPLRINLRSRPSGVTVNGVEVVKPDIKASNGIVHVVDQVLLAPQADIVDTLIGDDRFSTLVAAVTAAGLVDTLKGGPFTVFAPTNDAFAKLPPGTVDSLLQDVPALTEVLLRHVVPSTLYSRALVGNSFSTAGGDRAPIIFISMLLKEQDTLDRHQDTDTGVQISNLELLLKEQDTLDRHQDTDTGVQISNLECIFRSGDVTMKYSGKSDVHEAGVGISLQKEIAKSLMGFHAVSERVIMIKLKGKPFNYAIIQVSAPTSSSTEEEIGFIQKLKRLSFSKHPRRLWTWKSPDGRTKNQIDYIAISQMFRNAAVKVKSHPGADCDSDHVPVNWFSKKMENVNEEVEINELYENMKLVLVKTAGGTEEYS
ncbi:periostin [Penaeus vannamei]|uniref:periostin n=1 Tax=Penaeus vannamei TaxID=6689 RepID=UPI00387F5373